MTYDSDELELSDDHISRNDDIDNAAFDCIRIFAEEPTMEWDMSIIADVTEGIKKSMGYHGIAVRHPHIFDTDGVDRIGEYENGIMTDELISGILDIRVRIIPPEPVDVDNTVAAFLIKANLLVEKHSKEWGEAAAKKYLKEMGLTT